MNNPFEDLEYLAEFLPEEGESVIVSRRRGRLVCESYAEPAQTSQPTGIINREFYGRLVSINAKLQQFWAVPFVVAVTAFFVASFLLQELAGFGWADWGVFLALGTVLITLPVFYVHWRQRQFFRTAVCPTLQQLMNDHQIDKYSLIAYLSTQRQLKGIYQALTRWT